MSGHWSDISLICSFAHPFYSLGHGSGPVLHVGTVISAAQVGA